MSNDAHELAKSIAAAFATGRHGKPTTNVEGGTIYASFAGSDEFPPTAFVITVRRDEQHVCPHDGIGFKTPALLAEHMENVHHHYAEEPA